MLDTNGIVIIATEIRNQIAAHRARADRYGGVSPAGRFPDMTSAEL